MSRAITSDAVISTPVLAWLCALLPILAAHTAYLISAQQGHVPWCWPYWEGCTSISRAARHGDAKLLFKLLMLPASGLMALFWLRQGGLSRAAMWLGLLGTLALTIYVINLGLEGTFTQWLRRFGITFYFALTVLAQMLVSRARWRSGHPRRHLLLLFCVALLGLGLASLPLQHFVIDRDSAVNAIEWCYALLMSLFFPLFSVQAERPQA